MGAEYREIEADMPREKLAEWFSDIQNDAAMDCGHGGYTGTFAECRGLEITEEGFNHKEEASEYLQNHAKKWGPALAVRVGWTWLIGAWCSC